MRDQETSTRALIAELPRVREGYESLLAIARDTTPELAIGIISDLGRMPTPPDLQTEAAGILARQKLVGRTLADMIATTDVADAWRLSDEAVRIVYCWDGASVGTLAPFLAKLAARYPQLRWVGVCIDRDTARARALADGAALVGIHFYNTSTSNPVAEALFFQTARQAYLADRAGVIRNANALMETPRKLKGLGL